MEKDNLWEFVNTDIVHQDGGYDDEHTKNIAKLELLIKVLKKEHEAVLLAGKNHMEDLDEETDESRERFEPVRYVRRVQSRRFPIRIEPQERVRERPARVYEGSEDQGPNDDL